MPNKLAIITGAAKRVGAYLAADLASQRYDIAIHYLSSKQDAHNLCAKLSKQHNISARPFQADLSSETEITNLIANIYNEFARPANLLINNASIFEKDNPDNFSSDQLQEHLDINLKAPILLSRSFASSINHFKQMNHIKHDIELAPADIINIIDGSFKWSLSPEFYSYAISKMALSNATELLASYYAPDIKVNAIALGPTLPDKYGDEATFERLAQKTPLQKNVSLADIANACNFIVNSNSTTGQTIYVNSGLQLQFYR